MSDDGLDGISASDTSEDEDEALEGVEGTEQPERPDSLESLLEGIDVEPEEAGESVRERITEPDRAPIFRDKEEKTDVDVNVDLSTLAKLERNQTEVLLQMLEMERQKVVLEEQRVSPVTGQSTSSGPDNAAVAELGLFRKEFEVFYNFESNADDLIIEVSMDGNTWRPFSSLRIGAGGGQDVAKGDTVFTHVRAYGGSEFSDTDVNLVKIVTRGD